ncbi:exodeoxyribonuclease VII large subunit [Undibacterium sp. Jales W-56]|uniref:exodeoxyribonuclease VII large subunit n=1 Tax=Undibacterium sp. Jales W-56 TaxID=2897325 RepID=UPI0021CED7B6|nr:exodeoxyribonuclease VII large subunit [Undibacterium sp. Jales W-56]MCU6435552.1 exodeoxyribonuclease VII large subunit [Undibacterium sp. Jales W-56]
MTFEFHSSSPVTMLSVITVSALNQAVAQLLERNIPLTWVSGEISNFTRAASGHWYFTLKDAGAQVRAVMFRGRAQYADFMPREGDKVEVRALVSLYAPRGDYQINVEAIRRAGMGNLYEAFLQLKARLDQEGLFDPARKRPIPNFVKTIGIVSSPQAAALRDILSALQRRAPHIQVILYPTPVQGEGAANKIAQAIATASARAECDVLLVCRGGGSIEDLWAFNEEIVARTIIHCTMPVISGVGHETDFTIADFVADIRAATPTAAAELAATPRADWLDKLTQYRRHAERAMQRQLAAHNQTLDWLTRRLVSPVNAIKAKRQNLERAAQSLRYASAMPRQQAHSRLLNMRTRLQAQRPDLDTERIHLQEQQRRFASAFQRQTDAQRGRLGNLSAQLEMLNPQRTLERGYAILSDRKGKLIRSNKDLQPHSLVSVRLADGTAEIGISSVQADLD